MRSGQQELSIQAKKKEKTKSVIRETADPLLLIPLY